MHAPRSVPLLQMGAQAICWAVPSGWRSTASASEGPPPAQMSQVESSQCSAASPVTRSEVLKQVQSGAPTAAARDPFWLPVCPAAVGSGAAGGATGGCTAAASCGCCFAALCAVAGALVASSMVLSPPEDLPVAVSSALSFGRPSRWLLRVEPPTALPHKNCTELSVLLRDCRCNVFSH